MTDGKFNTFPSINMDRTSMSSDQIADARDRQVRESNEHTTRLCDNMRAQNVQVFAVGFDTSPDDEVTLRGCVTRANYFYSARDEAELRRAFSQIANKLSELRIAH
jgi:hypothetical protein